MSEDISVRSPAKHVQVGKRWLAVMKRVLVGVVLILLWGDSLWMWQSWLEYGPPTDQLAAV